MIEFAPHEFGTPILQRILWRIFSYEVTSKGSRIFVVLKNNWWCENSQQETQKIKSWGGNPIV